jgi:hypothetical protein
MSDATRYQHDLEQIEREANEYADRKDCPQVYATLAVAERLERIAVLLEELVNNAVNR